MPLSSTFQLYFHGFRQCRGLRPWSYDKTGLRPVPVGGLGLAVSVLILVLVLYIWSWCWSWSEHVGLVSNSVLDANKDYDIKHGVDPRAHALYLKLTKCYPRALWL